MTRSLFGTDGVRGEANSHPMTAEMALRLGAAVGRYFRRDGQPGHRAVIGKDTRLSGYMLETALPAGLTSTGMNVLLLGPVPTPAVGLLTRSMRADLGIMISASHNPSTDNGIKFFGPDGFKLSDEAEAEIEAMLGGAIQSVPEREKRIGSHDASRNLQTLISRLDCGNSGGIDAAHLACTDANRGAILGKHDSIALHRLDGLPCETKILPFRGGWCAAGDHLARQRAFDHLAQARQA